MKKPKKESKTGCLGAISKVLGELLGELITTLVCIAAGLPLYFLLPKNFVKNIDFDDLIVLGIPLLLLIGLIVWFVAHTIKKRKARRLTIDKQRYYKAFHCMYGNIHHLYDDLKATVTDIDIKSDIITVRHHANFITIEKALDGYRTRINGSKNAVFQPDETIYHYIMEFIHAPKKESEILEISDDRITAIEPHGILYTDLFDREIAIDFADCACECMREGSLPFGYIGECSAENRSYTFCTPHVKTKIVFDSFLVTGKKLHPLRGKRKKRFRELQKRIACQGYSVCEKNLDKIKPQLPS